ncbi:DUF2400 domain-containing protein, partial [bacterium]|nr:DUF2400 domain-containing protein [bacterium]
MRRADSRRRPGADALCRPEIGEFLETIYRDCNRRARLERDPLAIARRYPDVRDREAAGLVCSTLAFGAVDLIMRACERALAPLGEHPAAAFDALDDEAVGRLWADFKYRFCFPADIQALMRAIRDARRAHGSLEGLFLAGAGGAGAPGGTGGAVGGGSADVPIADRAALAAAAGAFVRELRRLGAGPGGATIRRNLLPDPADGSACKRLLLYLRWMVRRDDIDPGGWGRVSPSALIVPLDVHMARTCRERLGFLPPARATSSPTFRDALA